MNLYELITSLKETNTIIKSFKKVSAELENLKTNLEENKNIKDNKTPSNLEGVENKNQKELKEIFINWANSGNFTKLEQTLLKEDIKPETKSLLIKTFINSFNENQKTSFIENSDNLTENIIQELFLKSSSDLGEGKRNWRVQQVLVEHKNAPLDILKLAADKDSEIEPDFRVRISAIENKNLTDKEFLKEIYKKENNKQVKDAFIRNTNFEVPADDIKTIFEEYAESKTPAYYEKLEFLAKNPNTNPNYLIQIFIEAINELLKNVEISGSVTQKTNFNQIKTYLQNKKLLSVRKDSVPLKILKLIASNPNLKGNKFYSFFETLATSAHPEILEAIAQNIQTPKTVLEELSKTPNILVSEKAKKTLTKENE